jgi:uncharacterized membrane protein SpoIIM required for sporulation
MWLVYSYPDLVGLFASPQMIATVERGELWTDGMLNVAPSAMLSVSILTNNIVVAFTTFCAGLLFGLGTFYLIGLNGLSLGALFALTAQHGLGGRLFDFVIAHGCVELSCICIAGAAGSYMGEALIRPGARTRAEAFRLAATQGIRVLAVVTVLLFICGLIEGYISPDPEVPRWARVTIGVGYWLFMVSLAAAAAAERRSRLEPIRAAVSHPARLRPRPAPVHRRPGSLPPSMGAPRCAVPRQSLRRTRLRAGPRSIRAGRASGCR